MAHTDCNHSEAEQVTVPGWCPECETALSRIYEFVRQTESDEPDEPDVTTEEEAVARAEIEAEKRLDNQRERHFDREGHF